MKQGTKIAQEGRMSEVHPQHPQEPAEGSEENVKAPGADREDSTSGDVDEEVQRAPHPQEPAEGAEENVDAPEAER
jgi:hypothetical protein